MEIQFLGTGAADWGREFKGTPGYRRFSSCIVNDDLLIDPGPHIFDYTENVFDRTEQILMTHSHSDHLSPDTLRALGKRRERTLFGEKNGLSIANNIPGIRLSALPLFQEVVIGAYRVCALPANHGTEIPEEQAVHYTVSDGKKKFFYGCDGAWLRRETWYYLQNQKFDLIILDGTLGDAPGDYRIFEHNNLPMVELMSQTMRKTGILLPEGRIMISHLARETHGTQEEVEERLKKSNIGVCYDGEIISLS